MRRRIILAVAIAAALFGVVAAPALAQNSETPTKPVPMKAKPKAPAGATVTVKVSNWRMADLVELQVAESARLTGRKCSAR
jgi:hypothetical protein